MMVLWFRITASKFDIPSKIVIEKEGGGVILQVRVRLMVMVVECVFYVECVSRSMREASCNIEMRSWVFRRVRRSA